MSFGIISFTEWNWRTAPRFVGFDNYVQLLASHPHIPIFGITMGHDSVYADERPAKALLSP
jgi:ABC-type sugar transport system permease subunit